VDLFANYRGDTWPTLAQVRDLPPSLTGLGLDLPLAVILEATTDRDRQAVRQAMKRFCRGGAEDDHVCGCAAMDVEGVLVAPPPGCLGVAAPWSQMPFNGVPVGQYVGRFSAYD
jgi:hypothetical protein